MINHFRGWGVLAIALPLWLGCSDGGSAEGDAGSAAGGSTGSGSGSSTGGSDAQSPQPTFSEERIVEISTKLGFTAEQEEAFRKQLNIYERGRESISKIEDPTERQQAEKEWAAQLVLLCRALGGDALAAEVEAVLAGS